MTDAKFAALVLAIVIIAACFAVWPVLRAQGGRARILLAAAIAFFVAGVGAGTYLMLGRPALAVRTLKGPELADLNTFVQPLIANVRRHPDDARGWTMLAKVYLDPRVGDPADAAKALQRAIAIEAARGHADPELYSAYGDALVQLSAGAVPPEAEAAFTQALALKPKDIAARYYLGFAYAARGENAKAIESWQSLLADSPPGASYRQELIDKIAALSAASAKPKN